MDFTQAISAQLLIEITYDEYSRVVEPHAYGITEDGDYLLRAYQVSGGSESNQSVGWKLFRVDEIRSMRVLDGTFSGPRDGYKRDDKVMVQIIAQL